MTNAVNQPSHYTQFPVEVIEIVKYMSFCLGNITKYVLRAPFKNGVEDYDKAIKYLSWEKQLIDVNNAVNPKASVARNIQILSQYFIDKQDTLMASFLSDLYSYITYPTLMSLSRIEKVINALKQRLESENKSIK